MKRIKAAIIDDGADASQFGSFVSYSISRGGEIFLTASDEYYGVHAVMCMAVMNRYLKNKDIDWFDIRIIDQQTGLSTRKQLIKALEFCLENDVKVIHMSIGTTEFEDFPEIEDVVNKLTDRGTIIVAALSNADKLTYPACLENVIGVKTSPDLKEDMIAYVGDPYDNIEFLAASKHLVKLPAGYSWSTYSNSYAAPVVTAKVLNVLKENSGINAEKMRDILVCGCKVKMSALPVADDEKRVEVPVIGICMSDTDKAEESAAELSRRFISNGYDAVSCSIHRQGFFGFYEKDTVKRLEYMISFSACDVVVAVISDSIVNRALFDFDIIIADKNHVIDADIIEKSELIEYSDEIKEELYDLVISKFNE
ncbi:S8 family serine peptidase [Ruminococcus flavefaciens]|uniref:S8 family serine peptidase n=1 Tax=Ruminococcus flavefaciens TaxID=1265 RepID=UPI0026F32ADF|nr:S8 family serine peptidase [Ruminococcus flavefaciens]